MGPCFIRFMCIMFVQGGEHCRCWGTSLLSYFHYSQYYVHIIYICTVKCGWGGQLGIFFLGTASWASWWMNCKSYAGDDWGLIGNLNIMPNGGEWSTVVLWRPFLGLISRLNEICYCQWVYHGAIVVTWGLRRWDRKC